MRILGISAFYHDSAACIIEDGRVLAAAQEERFSRKKQDPGFPRQAVTYCLNEAGCSIDQMDHVVFYENPALKFDRLWKTYLMYAPRGVRSFMAAMPEWLLRKLWLNRIIRQETGFSRNVAHCEHHQSHAGSAFYPSPFERAAFLTMDGVGEWTTTSFGVGDKNRLQIHSELRFPHSLGMLYSAFTYYTGFKVNSAEYKVMGLAPYGEPRYVEQIMGKLVDVKPDGSFRLDMSYFNYCAGFTMTSEKFHRLFGRKPRQPESEVTAMDMDLARSIQAVTEEIVLRIGRHVHAVTGEKNLCLAGGVALNCVSNGRLLREGPFEQIWIQPAAGDAGGALGAALHYYFEQLEQPRQTPATTDDQRGSFLGPSYSDEGIQAFLDGRQLPYTRLDNDSLMEKVAELIAAGNVIAWFDGRMEFGPRALGARSILGDPRSPAMQSVMNLKIKFRESFRPFAPAVLHDKTHEWFDLGGEANPTPTSPYMLLVGPVRQDKHVPQTNGHAQGLDKLKVVRSLVPAVTHVDYSARVQTVHPETNPRFYRLIEAFHRKTGCPMLINTSFNVRGEPIVESPQDAYRCFMRTEMDFLVLGNYLIEKKSQPAWAEVKDWRKEFQLD
jgi:carbamoyltransferase